MVRAHPSRTIMVGMLGLLAWSLHATLPDDGHAAPGGDWVRSVGLTDAQLGMLRAQLASADADTRARAIRELGHLSTDSLSTIEARMRARWRRALPAEEARDAMVGFRPVGSRRADDDVDIEPGVSTVLSERRDRTTVAMAESLLLLRALERMQTHEAGLAMATFVGLDDGLWARELRRAQGRAGLWLLPALIELRSHERPEVKRWARRGVRALGMDDPKRATSVDDDHLAAQVVRAYANPLDFDAMPTLVRLVMADAVQVREAARAAVSAFGKNAIWQLRELYEELTAQRADHAWDEQRTARELYTVIDRERIETASTAFAEGMQRYLQGDFAGMEARFDRALSVYPQLPERGKMAVGYAALGDARVAADQLTAAVQAYQRALRLSPVEEDRRRYRARLWFARSEQALATGVVDLSGYDKALALDPELSAARRARELLDGTARRRQKQRRRWAAGAALALMLALLAFLIRFPGTPPPAPEEAESTA